MVLKLVSLAKNSMSLFCLPITNPNLIYHLLIRLQDPFHHQCFPGFSNPLNICISHDFAPYISGCIYQNWISFYQFQLLLLTFSGSFIWLSPLHFSTKLLSFLIHCNVFDEQWPWMIACIIVIQPPYRHWNNSGPWTPITQTGICAKLFPSEGRQGYASWSEFSARPWGLSDTAVLSNNHWPCRHSKLKK